MKRIILLIASSIAINSVSAHVIYTTVQSATGLPNGPVRINSAHAIQLINSTFDIQTYTIKTKVCAEFYVCTVNHIKKSLFPGQQMLVSDQQYIVASYPVQGTYRVHAVTSVRGDTPIEEAVEGTIQIY